MTTNEAEVRPILCSAGVEPGTDRTPAATMHYTHTDKVRFVDGLPEKLSGWKSYNFDDGGVLFGKCRSIFSSDVNGRAYVLYGTHTRLYASLGSERVNITPLETTNTAIANSLATHYGTLASNPITTIDGSTTITVADADADRYRAGDTITLSGSASVGGIPDTDINGDQIIRSIVTGGYTITVATAATSSTTGGGASIVRTSGLIRATAASHGQSEGDRVKISGATTTGGILNTEINAEHIIRNVAAGTFDFMTDGTATSSVSGGGGASTVYYKQIPAGEEYNTGGQGYGVGRYGVGRYGTALTSATAIRYMRTWYFDRYGDYLLASPGHGGGIYQWDGDFDVAPVLVTNAPTDINYFFVSDNILITFGSTNENQIYTSNQNNITQWTGSSSNQVYQDNIEGAPRLWSALNARGVNLIFCDGRCYTFQYIGLPNIWDIERLDDNVGIIAPNAGIVVNGVPFWMGQNNFYMWDGSSVRVVPSNTSNQCTCIDYVFNDINLGQRQGIFCWYNEKYREIWWHYPSQGSLDPDRVVRLCLSDMSWTIDTFDRTAAERPSITEAYPYLCSSSGIVYQHELGNDADGAAMSWTLTTKRLSEEAFSKNAGFLSAIIPDSIQSDDVYVIVSSYQWPSSETAIQQKGYTVPEGSERINTMQMGRFWTYTIYGSALGQSWKMGVWHEEIQRAGNIK